MSNEQLHYTNRGGIWTTPTEIISTKQGRRQLHKMHQSKAAKQARGETNG